MAIVALGCAFATDADNLKLTKTVSGANQLYWTASALTTDDVDATGKITNSSLSDISEKEYSGEVTYYASLVTNSSKQETLKVQGTAFVGGTSNYLVDVKYTSNSAEATATSETAVDITSKTETADEAKGLRIVSIPVTISASDTDFAGATADDYVATLTAIVDGQ